MKITKFHYLQLISCVIMFLTSCNTEENNTIPDQTNKDLLWTQQEAPFGKSLSQWVEAWWQSLLILDCAHQPIPQDENSVFNADHEIAFAYGPFAQFENGEQSSIQTRNATPHNKLNPTEQALNVRIPLGKDLLIPVFQYFYDLRTLEQSVIPINLNELEIAKTQISKAMVTDLDTQSIHIELDGTILSHPTQFMQLNDPFFFTAQPELANCLDLPITGVHQAALTTGYYLFIKNLFEGRHFLKYSYSVNHQVYSKTMIIDVILAAPK
ncbi:MAG: hypothetical protein K1X68_06995 [Saprospiraceae bacterium]|nr:hypothetical protein [Saprospiraceae bacterium]HMW40256.1 hypothetical protein [Saprospiraceae bacterium]HMX89624.1 hypothetical protein [Saprospiraceae bacterium]HMZ40686.1 hypothetical protein [Saprospiraceae bacterium]HNB31723.1 hypothetical protein [Saprospiraceae bacterium]